MAFLGFGKKKAPEKFNLKDYLSDEETSLMVKELETLAQRVPSPTSEVVSDLAVSIKNKQDLYLRESLDLCISCIGMNQGFKEAQEGSSALADKLRGIRKELTGK